MSTQSVKKISVLIVDDHPPFRAGLRTILEKTPDIVVVGEAEDGREAEKLLDTLRPNMILLDLKMPDFSPSAFEKWARDKYPDTVTLVLTAHDRDSYLANMMDAGAVGYLNKEARVEQLIEAIRRATSGESLFDEQQRIRAQHWHQEIEEKWNNLSDREKQVLRLLADGASNKDISLELHISSKTVDKHLERLYHKLEATSRAEAVLWGIKNLGDFPY
jgi:DNA-binding NarL/FixJ family response regulator